MTQRAPRSLLPAAEAGLIAVSLAVVVGFSRLFGEGSYMRPLVVLALGSHAVAIAARRARWSIWVAAAVSAVGLFVVLGWLFYGDTTTFGIPGPATLAAIRTDLGQFWTVFQNVKAPAPAEVPLVLAAGFGVWASAFIADWAAFRLWVPFEAMVPPATLFIFCSLLGASGHRAASAGLFAAAVLAFQLLHRVARLQSSTSWLATDVTRGTGSVLKVGALVAGAAVCIGVVLGPALPGDDSAALLPWRDIGDTPSSRVTVSPLVDIRGRLVDQANTEVFTVQSSVRSYWRLTALDTFDGSIWSSGGSYAQAHGRLPTDVDTSAQEETVDQQFSIESLAQIWLPVAFEPRSIEPGDTDVRYDPESSTLIVDTSFANSNGIEYSVQSAVPRFTAAELDKVGPDVPPSIAGHYLQLPQDFNSRVVDLAQQVTANAKTPYQQALALQQFFRENFTYSLSVPSGHSDRAIENFLFETRQGYCEQFAGSYAAMARAVGLPSRVAVGFTPGNPDPLHPDLYRVRGEHAHAWPEVYLSGYGWVPFEPTPGRGEPGAQAYTGVPESQAVSGNPGAATTLSTTPQTPGSNPFNDPDITGSSVPHPGNVGIDAVDPLPAKHGRPVYVLWFVVLAVGLGVVLAMAVLYVIAVPVGLWVRRARRRRRAEAPLDRVRVAWQESAEAMSVLGVDVQPSETHTEFAVRSARVVAPELCHDLAATADSAEYSSEGITAADADRALGIAGEISASVRRMATREQRARAMLDARPLLPGRVSKRRRVKVAESADGPSLEAIGK